MKTLSVTSSSPSTWHSHSHCHRNIIAASLHFSPFKYNIHVFTHVRLTFLSYDFPLQWLCTFAECYMTYEDYFMLLNQKLVFVKRKKSEWKCWKILSCRNVQWEFIGSDKSFVREIVTGMFDLEEVYVTFMMDLN